MRSNGDMRWCLLHVNKRVLVGCLVRVVGRRLRRGSCWRARRRTTRCRQVDSKGGSRSISGCASTLLCGCGRREETLQCSGARRERRIRPQKPPFERVADPMDRRIEAQRWRVPSLGVAVLVHVHEIHRVNKRVHARLLSAVWDRGVFCDKSAALDRQAIEWREGKAVHIVAKWHAHHVEGVQRLFYQRRKHA